MIREPKVTDAIGMRRPLSIAVAATIGVICAGHVGAEEADVKLKEMKVSAESDKPIQQRTELGKLTEYTPISGAVVDQEEIEHLQLVNNLLELGKRVPGISMVRNMRIPDGGKLYTENRIDGRRATSTNTSVFDEIDMAHIERIEVITGPASALYGSGALGGTISLYSRQPPPDFRAKLSQEAGSWGFARTQGNLGTTTKDGRFGFIVSASKMDNDGWRTNNAPANPNAAAEHKDGQAIKGFARLTDTTKLTLGYDQLHYDYRWAGTLGMNKFKQDWRQSEAGTYGQTIDNYKTISAHLQQLVGERGELTVDYGHITDDSTNYGGAGSGGANNVICDDTRTVNNTTVAAGKTVRCSAVNNGVWNGTRMSNATSTNTLKKGPSVTSTTTAMFRQEFDLAKSTLYVGQEVIDITAETATYNNAFNALQAQSGLWSQGTLSSAGSVTKTKESTPFVHFEFSPVDRLRFHLGERFGNIDYKIDDRTATNKDLNMTRSGNVLRSGVTYELNKSHLVWANWSETFNPQSTGSLLDSTSKGTAGNVIGATLAPERGTTREIGFRGRFQELGVHYDVTLYDAISNGFNTTRTCTAAEQTALNGGASCTVNEAAGQLATRGIESMLSWAATSWLDLGATYTNARAWFTDYKTTTVDYTGKSYQAMPRHKLNLRIGVKPAPGWLIELEGDHVSSYFVDNTNDLGTYARPDLFNLRASYRMKKDWAFWLHAINITNQQYATRVGYSTIAGQSIQAASAGQGNAGSYTPLNLRAGVSYSF